MSSVNQQAPTMRRYEQQLARAHHDDAEPVIAESVGGLDATAGS